MMSRLFSWGPWVIGCILLLGYGLYEIWPEPSPPIRVRGEIPPLFEVADATQVTAYRPVLDDPSLTYPYGEMTVAAAAADALARIGSPALPELIIALDDKDSYVRANAARSLALMGPDAEPAVPALIDALSDTDDDVRRNAARALGQIGPQAYDAVPALVKMLGERPLPPAPAAVAPLSPSEPTPTTPVSGASNGAVP